MKKARVESVSISTAPGGRSYQEDRCLSELIVSGDRQYRLMAVCDGHGGATVAEMAVAQIPELFRESLWRVARRSVTAALNRVVERLVDLSKECTSGSTLTIACIPLPFSSAYLAVLGDSPVLVCTAKREILGPIHNVGMNVAELDRALARGASFRLQGAGVAYIGKQGGVWGQVSRSLGDRDLSQYLDRTPEPMRIPLAQQSHILLASDGLWRPGEPSSEWSSRMAEMLRAGASAEAFVADGLSQYGEDNATAVVWRCG